MGESNTESSRFSLRRLFSSRLGNKPSEIVPVIDSENNEDERRRELMMQIMIKAKELTENPQTDIEPTDLLGPEGFIPSDTAYRKQLEHPELLNGKKIDKAITLNWHDGGQTSFIVVTDKRGNRASVRMNMGKSARAPSLFGKLEVDEEHQEMVVDVVRKGVKSKNNKYKYFYERFSVGGIPGQGMDSRVSEEVQIAFSDRKLFEHRLQFLGHRGSLSDIPPMLEQDGDHLRKAEIEDLRAVLEILETGQIDREAMSRGIILNGSIGLLLTKKQFEDKFGKGKTRTLSEK